MGHDVETDVCRGHGSGCASEGSSRQRPACDSLEGGAASGRGEARRARGWVGGAFVTLLLQLLFFATASAQFRGGTITWEPVEPGSNTVRFTVRSAWVRGAGTYVRVQNNIPTPMGGYQPVAGDVVKVQGIETPKFVVSTGYEEYLELKVTKNSRCDPQETDCVGPHDPAHWTWDSTNWFEGVSHYEVTLPSRDVTYVAELQGCCRMASMTLSEDNCIRPRDGKGVVKMCNSPYLLRATVHLSRPPPPVSFLPHFVPHAWEESTEIGNQTIDGLLIPVVPAPLYYRAASLVVEKPPIENWEQHVLAGQADAKGTLAPTALRIGPNGEFLKPQPMGKQEGSGARRLLMESGIVPEAEAMDLNALPVFVAPERVEASAAQTGHMVRMLRNSAAHIKLFAGAACAGEPLEEIMPGADICEGGSRRSGTPGYGSVLVPAGLKLEMSDECEFSDVPPTGAANMLEWGNVVATVDNTQGSHALCRALSSAEAGNASTFRVTQAEPSCTVPQGKQCTTDYGTIEPIATALEVAYVTAEDGFHQAVLKLRVGSFLANGNYPVVLNLRSANSAVTTVEFVLNVMNTPSNHLKLQTPVAHRFEFPTGFQDSVRWQFDGFGANGEIVFDNVDETTFGEAAVRPDARYVEPRSPGSEHWDLTWTPCTASAGLYYYCLLAVAKQEPGHEWAPMTCARVRVVEDLAPRIALYPHGESRSEDQAAYTTFMGQRLDIMVDAFDNARDTVGFVGVTAIDTNTGDSLRARLQHEYALLRGEVRSMPRLVDPGIPPFLSLTLSQPVAGSLSSQQMRVLSYVANRAHSGLEFRTCIMAGDSIGPCKTLQAVSERCVTVKVRVLSILPPLSGPAGRRYPRDVSVNTGPS